MNPEPEGVDALIAQLLHGKEMEERRDAAERLGELADEGDPQVVQALIAALNDENEWVRWRAAQSLGKLGDKRAIEPLIETLQDSVWRVRLAAVQALRKLQASEALPHLHAHLDPSYEPDAAIREAVRETIQFLKGQPRRREA